MKPYPLLIFAALWLSAPVFASDSSTCLFEDMYIEAINLPTALYDGLDSGTFVYQFEAKARFEEGLGQYNRQSTRWTTEDYRLNFAPNLSDVIDSPIKFVGEATRNKEVSMTVGQWSDIAISPLEYERELSLNFTLALKNSGIKKLLEDGKKYIEFDINARLAPENFACDNKAGTIKIPIRRNANVKISGLSDIYLSDQAPTASTTACIYSSSGLVGVTLDSRNAKSNGNLVVKNGFIKRVQYGVTATYLPTGQRSEEQTKERSSWLQRWPAHQSSQSCEGMPNYEFTVAMKDKGSAEGMYTDTLTIKVEAQ